jgi:hypothetical protein
MKPNSKKKQTANPEVKASYLLAYTIRWKTNAGLNKERDYYKIFCEFDEDQNPPEVQAKNRLKKLIAVYEDTNTMELYTWNIAKITSTSEHYPIEKGNKYTVGLRFENVDGAEFVTVDATNAYEARKIAKKQYREQAEKEDKNKTLYAEYILKDGVCIYNEYGFGATDAQLKRK